MVARQAVTRGMFAAFSHYRPRALTVLVLVVIATLIVLANLSFDVRGANGERMKIKDLPYLGSGKGGDFRQVSYGWPIVWHRYTLALWLGPSRPDLDVAPRLPVSSRAPTGSSTRYNGRFTPQSLHLGAQSLPDFEVIYALITAIRCCSVRQPAGNIRLDATCRNPFPILGLLR